MSSNDNKEPITLEGLNMLIQKMGHNGTYIKSCVIHPTYSYNELGLDSKQDGFVYDVDVMSDENSEEVIKIFNDLNRYTSIIFIFSSINYQ
jgi:hypothetical protein